MDTKHPVLLFDGVCNLCSGVVQWVARRQALDHVRFASLQSEYGQGMLRRHGLPADDLRSFVMVADGRLYRRSDAAVRLVHDLDGWWRLLRFMRFVPRFLRDWVYDFVARNRYRWFGRKDACMIPGPELRARFLDEMNV